MFPSPAPKIHTQPKLKPVDYHSSTGKDVLINNPVPKKNLQQ